MKSIIRSGVGFLILFSAFVGPTGWAQKYPERPVRLIVPFVAGGNIDVIARLFAQALSEELGHPFVVDNRAGANGNTGTEQVARSPANGYTLAMVSAATMAINPFLYQSMPFDTEKDLSPVSLVASGPMVLEVNNALPIQNIKALMIYAKAHPGKLNFGSGGNGSLSHLSFEMLRQRASLDIVHIPYKGTSMAANDLLAEHIQAMFDTLSTAVPMIKESRVRGLAVTSAKRSEAVPNLPTLMEAGVKDYSAEAWSGVVAPAGTPKAIITRLQTAMAKICQLEFIHKKLTVVGSQAVGNRPEEFLAIIRAERARWSEIVRVSGATLD